MNQFETSVRVDGDGGIHLAGLPFMPGTEVQIVVKPKPDAGAGDSRVSALMTALDRGHNVHTVGPLRREELYDLTVRNKPSGRNADKGRRQTVETAQ